VKLKAKLKAKLKTKLKTELKKHIEKGGGRKTKAFCTKYTSTELFWTRPQ
jgi:hypothetical protein